MDPLLAHGVYSPKLPDANARTVAARSAQQALEPAMMASWVSFSTRTSAHVKALEAHGMASLLPPHDADAEAAVQHWRTSYDLATQAIREALIAYATGHHPTELAAIHDAVRQTQALAEDYRRAELDQKIPEWEAAGATAFSHRQRRVQRWVDAWASRVFFDRPVANEPRMHHLAESIVPMGVEPITTFFVRLIDAQWTQGKPSATWAQKLDSYVDAAFNSLKIAAGMHWWFGFEENTPKIDFAVIRADDFAPSVTGNYVHELMHRILNGLNPVYREQRTSLSSREDWFTTGMEMAVLRYLGEDTDSSLETVFMRGQAAQHLHPRELPMRMLVDLATIGVAEKLDPGDMGPYLIGSWLSGLAHALIATRYPDDPRRILDETGRVFRHMVAGPVLATPVEALSIVARAA